MLDLQKQIAASLYLKPATLEELARRDFLANIANIDRLLFLLENKGWIFTKGGRYHTYKKIAETKLSHFDLK